LAIGCCQSEVAKISTLDSRLDYNEWCSAVPIDCAANLREQVEAQAQANKEKDSGSKKKGKKGKKEKSKGAYKLFALYSSG